MGRTGGRGFGRPRVRNYRDDRLARLDPREFERVVADYYRRQGYKVEHCGTGSGRSRFDGGIDLKMYRDGEYTIVQCKRENALQVTHNVGHELLGVLMTERADRAFVVNAGEFTRAAWNAAARNPQLELVDGDRLREMLPEYAVAVPQPTTSATSTNDEATSQRVHDWSLSAPVAKPAPFSVRSLDDDDRRRYRSRTGRKRKSDADGAKALMALAVLIALAMWQCSGPSNTQRPGAKTAPTRAAPAQLGTPPVASVSEPRSTPVRNEPRVEVRPPRPPDLTWRPPPGMSAEEAREAQRRADEAMKVIEAHTPELAMPPARR